MTKKLLITGINGFVGKHLAQYCKAQGTVVIGAGFENEVASEIRTDATTYYQADLTDSKDVGRLPLGEVDAVIHLAGLAAVGPSFLHPDDYISRNSVMLINLAETALKKNAHPRFIVVSSGAVYSPTQAMPLSETSRIGFSSPYVVSKILMENLCEYYTNRGHTLIVARPFNHIGPGQGLGFLLPDLAQQLQNAAGSGSITVGNLATKRDFTDVRDVVRAYSILSTKPILKHNIYNICSGASHSGNKILQLLQGELSLSSLRVKIDNQKIRPTDAADIYGSFDRLNRDTGWKPVITLEQTIKDYTVWMKQSA